MSALAERLRAARERKGVGIYEAALETHIRGVILEALESGDYRQLPPPPFTRGLLRNYAAYLGLDAEVLLEDYAIEAGLKPPPSVPLSPEPENPYLRSQEFKFPNPPEYKSPPGPDIPSLDKPKFTSLDKPNFTTQPKTEFQPPLAPRPPRSPARGIQLPPRDNQQSFVSPPRPPLPPRPPAVPPRVASWPDGAPPNLAGQPEIGAPESAPVSSNGQAETGRLQSDLSETTFQVAPEYPAGSPVGPLPDRPNWIQRLSQTRFPEVIAGLALLIAVLAVAGFAYSRLFPSHANDPQLVVAAANKTWTPVPSRTSTRPPTAIPTLDATEGPDAGAGAPAATPGAVIPTAAGFPTVNAPPGAKMTAQINAAETMWAWVVVDNVEVFKGNLLNESKTWTAHARLYIQIKDLPNGSFIFNDKVVLARFFAERQVLERAWQMNERGVPVAMEAATFLTPIPPTATRTLSPTPTSTFTITPTRTNTPTLTSTPTRTFTLTPTVTSTPTVTPTPTQTPTPTPTRTQTATPRPTPTKIGQE